MFARRLGSRATSLQVVWGSTTSDQGTAQSFGKCSGDFMTGSCFHSAQCEQTFACLDNHRVTITHLPGLAFPLKRPTSTVVDQRPKALHGAQNNSKVAIALVTLPRPWSLPSRSVRGNRSQGPRLNGLTQCFMMLLRLRLSPQPSYTSLTRT